MEIQSEAFGSNLNLSIKFITCDYHDKDSNDLRNEANVNMEYLSYFQMTLIRMHLINVNIWKSPFTGCMR